MPEGKPIHVADRILHVIFNKHHYLILALPLGVCIVNGMDQTT